MIDKINAKDTLFCIPVTLDSRERLRNLSVSFRMLKKYFDTNVIVATRDEKTMSMLSASDCSDSLLLVDSDKTFFHRTRILNEAFMRSDADIYVSYDCDVISTQTQLSKAISAIRGGDDICYPYTEFMEITDDQLSRTISSDFSHFPSQAECKVFFPNSVGGCIFFKRKTFVELRGMNENFLSFGPEDRELFHRYAVMKKKRSRISGNIFHMSHPRFADSGITNPYFSHNNTEYERLLKMNTEEMTAYISSNMRVLL